MNRQTMNLLCTPWNTEHITYSQYVFSICTLFVCTSTTHILYAKGAFARWVQLQVDNLLTVKLAVAYISNCMLTIQYQCTLPLTLSWPSWSCPWRRQLSSPALRVARPLPSAAPGIWRLPGLHFASSWLLPQWRRPWLVLSSSRKMNPGVAGEPLCCCCGRPVGNWCSHCHWRCGLRVSVSNCGLDTRVCAG